MHCVLYTRLLALLLYDKMLSLKKSTLPVPFANDKYYGSKPTMYGTRNKIRGVIE